VTDRGRVRRVAASRVYSGLGGEPGVALPAFRYRRSGWEVREQIRWLAFAASFVGAVYFGSLITQLLFAPDYLISNETPPLWVSLGDDATGARLPVAAPEHSVAGSGRVHAQPAAVKGLHRR
jgi:hypothetical protein